jgi:NAD+ synthase (glutamine-hydrolysing)
MRPPSAELQANQKDQDTLPPYELLDAILKLYIEENIPYKELITRCGFPQEIVQAMIKKFYQSEFKRQQYAPILKLSRKSLGPGRIVPIAHRYQPF